MWTKQQIIDEAYAELALQGFVYNLSPEMILTALRRLDSMMATWNGKGIRIGYALPSSPSASNLDDASGLPDWANEAAYTNLALRIASGLGKVVARETQLAAKESFDVVMQRCAFPQEQQLPSNLPRGSGNKPYRYYRGTFFPGPVEQVETTTGDSTIDFN